MNKAKVLLMAIGAIGIVGGAIAAKAKNHFSVRRCTTASTNPCNITPAFKLDPSGSSLYCDKVTAKHCTVLTLAIGD